MMKRSFGACLGGWKVEFIQSEIGSHSIEIETEEANETSWQTENEQISLISKNFILEATLNSFDNSTSLVIGNSRKTKIRCRDVNPIYVAADSCHK